ncbi:hypothetical protein OY671_009651, partial [Metschnikowia pulcherrima]
AAGPITQPVLKEDPMLDMPTTCNVCGGREPQKARCPECNGYGSVAGSTLAESFRAQMPPSGICSTPNCGQPAAGRRHEAGLGIVSACGFCLTNPSTVETASEAARRGV